MSIYRLSYSVLNPFSQGNTQQALDNYLKVENPSPEMIKGKEMHTKWEKEILELDRIPMDFGKYDYQGLLSEQKYSEMLPFSTEDETAIFSGVIDCIVPDIGLIIDFKYTTSSSADWLSSYQLGCYYYLLHKHMPLKLGSIFAYNRNTGDADTSYRLLTDKYLSETENWILSNSREFISWYKNNHE